MAESNEERPHIEQLPGAWPSTSANSFRQEYLRSNDGQPLYSGRQNSARAISSEVIPLHGIQTADGIPIHEAPTVGSQYSLDRVATAVPTPTISDHDAALDADHSYVQEQTLYQDRFVKEEQMKTSNNYKAMESNNYKTVEPSDYKIEEAGDYKQVESGYAPIKTEASKHDRPRLNSKASGKLTQEDISRALSRRKTNGSVLTDDDQVEMDEIERLMSRMFGQNRQAQSEDERTRHVGLVFKNLSVKGMGLGASLQPSVADFFLGIPRLINGLLTNPKQISGKPPVRTLLNKFTGCVKPGEMLLVLGAPGSGCSTFLKVLANQRYGYESVEGDVTYGGTDAKIMAKDYRGEVLYNPEDDLHYATLSVKDTLSFALTTRTPGKSSRNEGESRSAYVKEFLRVVTKLFWIEHTLKTKVGNEYVRGVSGGEKKRVSIAEAMITKASVQCWDNSTRGLDASTALEYVEALRSLTNMAQISTSVALYQAGESLYDLFDKVVLIHEGKCLYFGPTSQAATYFEGLGFTRPARWTTADFVS